MCLVSQNITAWTLSGKCAVKKPVLDTSLRYLYARCPESTAYFWGTEVEIRPSTPLSIYKVFFSLPCPKLRGLSREDVVRRAKL